MKLRQKLAMVLATAMVVTAVPVVTYAESTNKLSHPISSVDGTVTTAKDELKLIMDFGQTIEKNETIFYLNAKDFKFSQTEYAKLKLDEKGAKTTISAALASLSAEEIAEMGVKVDGHKVTAINEVTKLNYSGTKLSGVEAKVTYVAPKADVETEAKTATVTIKADQLCKIDGVKAIVEKINDILTYGEIVLDGSGREEVEENSFTTSTTSTTTRALAGGYTDKAQIKIEYLDSDQLRITVFSKDGKPLNTEDVKVGIPVLGTVGKGTPTITVDPLDSYATGGTYFLTRESVEDGNELAVKVGDAASIPVDGGTIASVTITEREEGAIFDAATAADRTVTFTLPASSDLVFSKESVQEDYITLTGKRAFAPNKDQKIEDLEGCSLKVTESGKKLEIVLPTERKVDTTTGEWIISGIQVEPEDTRYEATTGDVNVTIDGEMIKEETHKMAVVTEFDQTLTAKEVVELYSGKGSKEVVLTLKEEVKESLDDKRWAYFELTEGAYIVRDKFDTAVEKIVKVNINGDDVTAYNDNLLQVIEDKDGNITGFKVQFEYKNTGDTSDKAKGKLDPNKANVIKFTFNVQADTETTGAVEVKTESRAFEVDPVQIANVKAPIEVSFDATTVKVGLEKQALGKITVKEAEAGMLTKGELVIDTDEAGIEFVMKAKDLKVTTPEGSTLKVEVNKVTKDGGIVLSIDRQSKEASEFTIEGIVADINRTVPEGEIAVEVYGDALRAFDGVWGDPSNNDKDGHKPNQKFVYEDNKTEEFDAPHRFVADGYIVVGTKNTEDIQDASKQKEVILVINSTTYTVDGVEKTATAAPFIDANNRTMVPLRLVSEEFGAKVDYARDEKGVGTITIYKEGTTLQFKNGSKVMNKNGIQIPMDTAAVIKDDVTYVPFKFVANGLNAGYSFDQATKTVTFKN